MLIIVKRWRRWLFIKPYMGCIKYGFVLKQFFDKVVRNGVEMNRFTEVTEKELSCLLAQKKEHI